MGGRKGAADGKGDKKTSNDKQVATRAEQQDKQANLVDKFKAKGEEK